ncbi:MAG: hypothetical protein CL946_00710 [Ectothiorhodospiraceae bacterium]|nr:hypothetical protein [Ectothiorhodospiraceae bacterium]
MTPYHDIFLPIFGLGCAVALMASLVAGWKSGCLWPGALLLIGVAAVWASMFIGSDLGYRAWQAIPNPPEEAFSDASVMGALVFGWFPSGVFCLTIFAVVRVIKLIIRWANPTPAGSGNPATPKPIETGNPYQQPNS